MECKVSRPEVGTRTRAKAKRNPVYPGRLKHKGSVPWWAQSHAASSNHFSPWSNSLDQFGQIPAHRKQIERIGNTTQPKNKINITAVIEGNGPYLCGFRGSSELNSAVISTFVRELGIYRCYFHGGTIRFKAALFGSGFYQCFFQRPGSKIVVRQGVGQFFCFCQGIRHAKGFISPPKMAKKKAEEKKNFFYIFGSVNYAVRAAGGKTTGMGQLIGIYNYGPEGKGRNYGLLQGTESYNLNLESIMGIGTETTKSQSEVLTQLKNDVTGNSDFSVNQVGQFQYHFYGADIDEGRGDRFKTFVYNFIHTFSPHIFTLQFIFYEINGQGRGPQDDREFVQTWAFYKYNFEPNSPQITASFFQAFAVGHFNIFSHQVPYPPYPPGIEFIQFILQYSINFNGFRTGDFGALTWTVTYQSNIDTITPDYLVTDGEDELSGLMIVDDLVISVLQVIYNFVRNNRIVTGFVQFYGVYQYYLNEVNVDPPGYFQFILVYTSTHRPFLNRNHMAVWSVNVLAEYVLGGDGENEITNGAFKLQGNLVIDTTGWFEWAFGNKVPPQTSTITFQYIYTCLWFGIRTFHPICYFQIYAFYTGSITALVNPAGAGTAILLCQYYQDVRL